MKQAITLIILFCLLGNTYAQESGSLMGPRKGNVNISLLMGKSQSFSSWLSLPQANQTSYSVQNPEFYPNLGDNSAVNMIGVEGKWFFSDKWALRISGMGNISASKGYDGLPGATGTQLQNGAVLLPYYGSVPTLTSHEAIANIGLDRYFATKNEHLFWYIAPVLNFQYARLTGQNNATYVPITTGSNAFKEVDPGTNRYGEGFGAGLSLINGFEYYTIGGIFFGFEIHSARYTYFRNTQLPMEGLSTLKADTHNVKFLSEPMLKVGFKF